MEIEWNVIMIDNILFYVIERLINYDYYLEYFESIHFFCIYIYKIKLNELIGLNGFSKNLKRNSNQRNRETKIVIYK